MRVNLVYAAGFQCDQAADTVKQLRDIGPAWGSWRTWKSCNTDNVICHDLVRARELYKRAAQAVCNLYLPQKFFQPMNRPSGVNFYQGEFLQETQDLEDIIAMHLAASRSDLVLLFGFDLATLLAQSDALVNHSMTNRMGLIRQVLVANADVQWVLVDHDRDLDPAFQTIANLTRDKLENVLQLLG